MLGRKFVKNKSGKAQLSTIPAQAAAGRKSKFLDQIRTLCAFASRQQGRPTFGRNHILFSRTSLERCALAKHLPLLHESAHAPLIHGDEFALYGRWSVTSKTSLINRLFCRARLKSRIIITGAMPKRNELTIHSTLSTVPEPSARCLWNAKEVPTFIRN